MPTLARVRQVVDDRLTDLWLNEITPRQDAFFAARGRYWQGLRTFALTALPNNPQDGSSTVLEVTPLRTVHPTDQAETWDDVGINLGTTIPCALQIDVYDGPLGKGYVGTVWAMWDGDVYSRAQNRGPETWRTDDWRRLTSEEARDMFPPPVDI